jgi:hypothetical protein
MRVFPIRRPSVGVSVGPRGVTLVEAARPWRRRASLGRIRKWREHELAAGAPAGAGPAPPSALSSLSNAFRHVRGTLRGPVPVALSLWDPCGHAAVLAFDTLPAKKAEFETLVRWRLERELNVPAIGTRVVYQVFRNAGSRKGQSTAHVLAASIGTGLLAQYEEACLQAGLFPASVGLTTFQLFDLCGAAIRQTLGVLAREAAEPVDECFFLHRAAWGFSLLAVRSGSPVFIRVKPWLASTNDDDGAEGDVSASAGLDQEILATLQYYGETIPRVATAPRPLFFVSTVEGPAVDPDRLRAWGIHVHTLTLDGVGEGAAPVTALPALAAVHAA